MEALRLTAKSVTLHDSTRRTHLRSPYIREDYEIAGGFSGGGGGDEEGDGEFGDIETLQNVS